MFLCFSLNINIYIYVYAEALDRILRVGPKSGPISNIKERTQGISTQRTVK